MQLVNYSLKCSQTSRKYKMFVEKKTPNHFEQTPYGGYRLFSLVFCFVTSLCATSNIRVNYCKVYTFRTDPQTQQSTTQICTKRCEPQSERAPTVAAVVKRRAKTTDVDRRLGLSPLVATRTSSSSSATATTTNINREPLSVDAVSL